MIVGIDTSPLAGQSATRGIGMYTKHLVSHLAEIGETEVFEITDGEIPKQVQIIHYPFFDLFFATLPMIRKRPTVVTIHDVTPLVLPQLYPVGLKGKFNLVRQKLALRSVNAILTDSVASRNDIVKYLNVALEKVFVVPLAAQEGLDIMASDELKAIGEKFKLPSRYVVYVGDVNPNKNLRSLVNACESIECSLLIVGKQAVNQDIDTNHPETQDLVWLQKKATESPYLRLLGYVETSELAGIYRMASMACIPSLYEGFGLPVLEAFSCGCPVVTTKNGSLPEVGGDAAIYAHQDSKGLAKAISFVLKLNDTNRQKLVQLGFKQAKKFSWRETADKTRSIYQQILNSR